MPWPFRWGGAVPQPGPPPQMPNVGGRELPFTLATEPLVGYRSWMIRNGLTGLCLASLFVNYEWTATDNQAYCDGHGSFGRTHKDPAPSPGCSCGLYVNLPDMPFSEWNHLTQRKIHATGQVALSGRIIRCQKGYKAGVAAMISPLMIETPCRVAGCVDGIRGIILPAGSQLTFEGVCATHVVDVTPSSVIVKADQWILNARRVLESKYPHIEFLSFVA